MPKATSYDISLSKLFFPFNRILWTQYNLWSMTIGSIAVIIGSFAMLLGLFTLEETQSPSTESDVSINPTLAFLLYLVVFSLCLVTHLALNWSIVQFVQGCCCVFIGLLSYEFFVNIQVIIEKVRSFINLLSSNSMANLFIACVILLLLVHMTGPFSDNMIRYVSVLCLFNILLRLIIINIGETNRRWSIVFRTLFIFGLPSFNHIFSKEYQAFDFFVPLSLH